MSTTRAQLIATLEQTHTALARLTSQVPEAALDLRAAPEDWSVREVLAHLVDDEIYVMRVRLERLVKEDHPRLTPHDEKAWFAHRNTSRDQMRELLEDFALQRAASLGVIRMLRESDWAREGYHPEIGVVTAEQWLGNWVEHDLVHLRQIEGVLTGIAAQSGR
jgi:hypothetical protein